jgi:hypothetical protein
MTALIKHFGAPADTHLGTLHQSKSQLYIPVDTRKRWESKLSVENRLKNGQERPAHTCQ